MYIGSELLVLLKVAIDPEIAVKQGAINRMYRLNAEGVEIKSYAKGSAVVRGGDPLNKVYILVRGNCCISRSTSDGRTILSAEYEGSTVFGICELIGGLKQYDDTVVAVGPSCIMSVDAEVFSKCLEEDHTLQDALLRSLAAYVRATLRHSDQISTHNNMENLLLYISNKCTDRSFPCVIGVNKNRIAEELNMNLRTLYRQLDALTEKDYITRAHRKIVVDEQQYIRMKQAVEAMFSNK